MRRLVFKAFVAFSLASLFVIMGYMFAVLSFREELWVDYRSGACKTTCSLFPFSLSRDDQNDGFRVLFGYSPDETAEWGRIGCRHFVRSLDQEAITEGELLVRAESALLWSLAYTPVVNHEAQDLSEAFYAALRARGIEAADDYAQELYRERGKNIPQLVRERNSRHRETDPKTRGKG